MFFLVMVFPDVTTCIFELVIFLSSNVSVCAHVSTVDIYVTYSLQGHTSLIKLKLVWYRLKNHVNLGLGFN